MRGRAWVVCFVVLAAGLLAGCAKPADVPTPTPQPVTPASVTPPPSPLVSAGITASGAKWIPLGGSIDVSVAPPSNAEGAVSYLWAIGALPGTAPATVVASPDTGSAKPGLYLQPGQSSAIKFTLPGQWQMHCHPHPWMRSNITVVENYSSAPTQVDVDIVDDGAHTSEFRYVPENVTIGVGTIVVFHNKGTQPHTATSLAQDPAVAKLPIEGAKGGSITLKTSGWQRVRAYYGDAKGRSGASFYDVYVGALPVFQKDPVAIEFAADANALVPAAAQPPIQNSFVTSYNGTMFLNFTVSDAGAPVESAGGQNLAQVAVHLKRMGDEKDLVAKDCASSSKGEMVVRTTVGTYLLEIDPCGGVQTTGSLTIEDAYDLEPPPPVPYSSASAGHHH